MTLRHVDVEYSFDDPDDGWFGSAAPADFTPTVEATTPPAPIDQAHPVGRQSEMEEAGWDDATDTDRWNVQDLERRLSDGAPVDLRRTDVYDVPGDDRADVATVAAAAGPVDQTWESRLSRSGAWDFKVSNAKPWFRTRAAGVALIVAATAAAGVAVVLLISGGSSPAVEETKVAPVERSAPSPTSNAPVPTTITNAPPPPLPLPPPPPPSPEPSVEVLNPPPAATRDYYPPQRQSPSESKQPEIGVTRTPVTRAPMSATPPPPPAKDRNSSTPGDAPKRHGWF